MQPANLAAKSLVAGGLLLVAIGQCCWWFTIVDDTQSRSLRGRLEDALFIHHPVGNDIFLIEAAESRSYPDGTNGHLLVRVLLANRLSQPVTILGGTKGCTVAGCCSLVLDGPLVVAPEQRQWLEFDVKWTESPVKPVTIGLFTNISLTSRIELEVSPVSVTVGRKTLTILDLEGKIPSDPGPSERG